jgi:hypothetical protein
MTKPQPAANQRTPLAGFFFASINGFLLVSGIHMFVTRKRKSGKLGWHTGIKLKESG